MSVLGWTFFALSLDYKKIILDEIFFLVKNANFSYVDVMTMPTYERKYFIGKVLEEYDTIREEREKSNR
jgi:hypothetical protein